MYSFLKSTTQTTRVTSRHKTAVQLSISFNVGAFFARYSKQHGGPFWYGTLHFEIQIKPALWDMFSPLCTVPIGMPKNFEWSFQKFPSRMKIPTRCKELTCLSWVFYISKLTIQSYTNWRVHIGVCTFYSFLLLNKTNAMVMPPWFPWWNWLRVSSHTVALWSHHRCP